MTTPDPFPSELVEAAEAAIIAVVEDKLQWNVNAYGKAWTGEGEDTDFICSGTGQAVLAAVLPLIEQRVIERLAREAAGGPVPDDHPGVLASLGPLCTLTMDTSERERVKMAQIVIHAARPYLAACGVAAERARTVALARAIKRVREIEMFPDDESRDADYGPACMDLEDALSAALAPERTTTPEPEGEK